MTDRAVILRKLTALREHVDRMRRRSGVDLDAWRRDIDRQDALGMSLLVAVQNALDIALHIASDEGWVVPASPNATLDNPTNQADGWFGWSVVSAGDINDDGYADLVRS